LWCGAFNGNSLAMFDPKTQKITEWKVPTAWTRPYDAQFDDKTYAWTAGMDNDLAVRLNTQTGEFTEYLLPHETNVRHVEVQKSGAFSSMWLGDQHGGTIIRIEPLAP
jgi:streptogramin lyase